jgi:hypothetical protein
MIGLRKARKKRGGIRYGFFTTKSKDHHLSHPQ